ncbi:hypothetical protein GHJ82_28210 [Sinorhizobium saheli]|nr:hypothetical protein [Sinorhizobium saheli]
MSPKGVQRLWDDDLRKNRFLGHFAVRWNHLTSHECGKKQKDRAAARTRVSASRSKHCVLTMTPRPTDGKSQ